MAYRILLQMFHVCYTRTKLKEVNKMDNLTEPIIARFLGDKLVIYPYTEYKGKRVREALDFVGCHYNLYDNRITVDGITPEQFMRFVKRITLVFDLLIQ